MAVFVTGDTHGDFSRLKRSSFYEQAELTKTDYLVICGDFGLWDGSPEERFWLDWLEARPFTTLFVAGNHSNYDLLDALPVIPWHGGLVQPVRPSVLHLMRGQVYDIDSRRFFAMGGASSHDIEGGILEPGDPRFRQKRRQLEARGLSYRVNHRSWWARELPCEAEYRTARENLERAGWRVDFIVTHCAPTGVQAAIDPSFRRDALTDFLEEIQERCQFSAWFFGHYHHNRRINDRFILVYEQILRVL